MPEIRTASCRAEFKALPGADGTDEGVFEAIVSVFGNVDFGGDRVVKGAFADTLAQWAAKGDPIPVIWSHQWGNPDAHVGVVLDAREVDEGLYVKGKIDLGDPFSAKVFRLLKQRRVTQFSFGYEAAKWVMVEDPEQEWPVRELQAVGLWEVGPTLLGMNPDTQLLSAASRPEPAAAKAPDVPVTAPRDDAATIATERRAAALMARTRHTEEQN